MGWCKDTAIWSEIEKFQALAGTEPESIHGTETSMLSNINTNHPAKLIRDNLQYV